MLDGERRGCPPGTKPRPDGNHFGDPRAAGPRRRHRGPRGHALLLRRHRRPPVESRHGARTATSTTTRSTFPDGVGGGAGISLNGPGTDLLIERNVVTDNVPANNVSGSGIGAVADLDRLTIRDNVADRNNGNGILIEDCVNTLVEGNVVRDNVGDFTTWGTAGVWLDGGHDVTIRGNWLEGNVRAGIEISDETPSDPYGYDVHDNVLVANRYGLWLDGIGRAGATPNRVYANTVVDSTPPGSGSAPIPASVSGSVASPLTETEVTDNLAAQIATDAPALAVDGGPYAAVLVDRNLWHRAASATPIRWRGADLGLAAYQAASGWDAAALSADPRFADAASHDFHLGADSPAIDAGSPAPASLADFDGKPRPVGAPPTSAPTRTGRPSPAPSSTGSRGAGDHRARLVRDADLVHVAGDRDRDRRRRRQRRRASARRS